MILGHILLVQSSMMLTLLMLVEQLPAHLVAASQASQAHACVVERQARQDGW